MPAKRKCCTKLAPAVAAEYVRAADALPDHALIDERTVAALSAHAVKTVQRWRVSGDGPAFVRVAGRSVRYRIGTVREWLASRTSPPLVHSARPAPQPAPADRRH